MENPRYKHIKDEEWESRKSTIQRLYVEERRPLTARGGVRDIMRTKHGFSARFATYDLWQYCLEDEQRVYSDFPLASRSMKHG
jgi:hypothetical protein